jgi:DNA repair protein RadA
MVDSPHHPEQEVIFGLGEAGVIDPDSETKKKTAKTTKSKAEPEVKAESKTDSVDADAKIEDIPEDSE